jgi:hypothetical protein
MALPKGIGSKAFAFDRLKNEFSCSLARIWQLEKISQTIIDINKVTSNNEASL